MILLIFLRAMFLFWLLNWLEWFWTPKKCVSYESLAVLTKIMSNPCLLGYYIQSSSNNVLVCHPSCSAHLNPQNFNKWDFYTSNPATLSGCVLFGSWKWTCPSSENLHCKNQYWIYKGIFSIMLLGSIDNTYPAQIISAIHRNPTIHSVL